MSASLKAEIRQELRRELEAVYLLLRSLSEATTHIEARLKALERPPQHGNRQRSTNRSD